MDDALVKGQTAAAHTAFAISAASQGGREPVLQAEAVGGIWFLWCWFGVSFVEGLIPLVLSCLLLCFNAFAAGKRDVFTFKIRTKRKESFVNEIKSRMCSLGVKSKSRHHSFIYFHF